MSARFSPAVAVPLALALAAGALVPLYGETLENVETSGQFNLCANPNALPYASEEAETPGFQRELHDLIAQAMGWQARVTWLNDRTASERLGCGGFMARMLRENGEPLVPLKETPNSQPRVTRPYLGTGFVVVLPVGARSRFASLGELAAHEPFRAGKALGVALGIPGIARIERAGIRTAPYLYQEQIIDAVLAGELAGGLVARENAAWYLRRRPGTFAQFDLYRADPEFRWNVGMELRGANPTVVATINQILAKLSRDGTLERIMARYGIVYQPPFGED